MLMSSGNWRHHMGNRWRCDRIIDYIIWHPMSQLLPPITTSHRHHFPDDVVNNSITSPPITHVLSPIITSNQYHLPMWCYQSSSGKWCRCDVVIGDSTCVIGGDVIGLLTTSSGRWCRCDTLIGGSTCVICLLSMCCGQLTHHIRSYAPCAAANYHNTLGPISQVLPRTTTSDRHHFPDDVVNNPITSPPITHVLPITTSHQHHLPMSCGNWRQHLGNRMQCDVVIGDSTWVLGGDVMWLLTTSSGKWCRCDVVIGGSTWEIGRNVLWAITHVLPPITISHCVLFPRRCHQLLHHIDIISYMM
jgi:hypothetical protein